MDFEQKGSLSLQADAAATQVDQSATVRAEKSGNGTYPDLDSLLAALEHERIAALAYFFWQQRGCPAGSPDDDWFQAEREIRESR